MPDTLPLLILPHRRAPGTVQMALDASLLHWASVGPDRVVFRTYAWSRPTLSLGRAEPFPEGWDVDAIREDGVDVARRPTGGDAVLHATELTFAVAASLPGPWNVRPRGFADLVAEALARAFQEAGLAAERSVPAPRDANAGRARPGLHACFSRLAPGEFFGEIALIDDGTRMATITALTDLVCYGLTYWDFRPVVEANGVIGWKLLQRMAGMLREERNKQGR